MLASLAGGSVALFAVCDPRSKRPAVVLPAAELERTQRDYVRFRLGAVLLAVAAVVIYAVSGRGVAALAAGSAAAVSLGAAWWVRASVRRRLRPVWRWEAARARLGLPLSFGRGCGWLAVRGAEPAAVVAALRLEAVRPADWRRGVRAAYEGRVFVTPVIDGWVLAVSTRLPEAGPGADEPLTPFLVDLSRRLDATVLAFATNPQVGYSHVARAEAGTLRRARADVGEPRRRLFDRGDARLDGLPATAAPTAEQVFAVAGRWSVDPDQLDDRATPVGDGWLGALPRPG
jgi:hypothetical protein